MPQNTPAYNPKNERLKRDYLRHIQEARGRTQTTVDAARKAICRFERYTRFKDFHTFNKEQAIGFKRHLLTQKSARAGNPISPSTALHTLHALKDFFAWLAGQRGYKSRIQIGDLDYLRLTDKETRAAHTPRPRAWPTLEQIQKAVEIMPTATEIDRRNRAVLVFSIVTGMRDRAIASLRLKHIDLDRQLIRQDPREVATKFSKYIETTFFPVGNTLQQIVHDWVIYLRQDRLFGADDPVFPKTLLTQDENNSFKPGGLSHDFWADAAPIRQIFRDAFTRAGLPYFNPHSFRKTLADLGQRTCQTPEEYKAWSQNLGHEDVLTTFRSYGQVSTQRQAEVMQALAHPKTEQNPLSELVIRMAGIETLLRTKAPIATPLKTC
jgi:integrase/recombinase XerD